MMNRSLLAALVLAAVVTGGTARASIIPTSTTVIPPDNYTPPSSIVGTEYGTNAQQTGTVSGQYVSPFSEPNAQYVAVQPGGKAEYYFSGLYNTLSLVWGSPDSYNQIYLYNDGSQVGKISGGVFGSAGSSRFVTLTSTLDFNRAEFYSFQSAFEFSNVQVAVAAVPLPPGVSLLAAALGVLGLFGMARRRANSLQ